jgi:DNA-binding beta-propeller fold protein YncE
MLPRVTLRHLACLLAGLGVLAQQSAYAAAPAADCNQPARDAVTWVDLPGARAFQALPSDDGCWIFVSLATGDGAAADDHPEAKVAVFSRSGGRITLARTVHIGGNPTGMVLTHDQRTLIVADGNRLAFLDTARLITSGDKPVLGYWNDDTPAAGRTYVNVTADDRIVFVSDENARSVSVIDLEKATRSGYAAASLVGRIPVGAGPVAVTLSPDGRWLYVTTLSMPPAVDWPQECVREWQQDPRAQRNTQGAVFVIDVARATTDPANSVVATVKAGCTPVRLVMSPDGAIAYVSARGEDALLVFDTAKLRSNSAAALVTRLPTGAMPIGIAVIDGGSKVVVANSNRFGAAVTENQSLLVFDAARILDGAAAQLGTIDARALPREMRVTADQQTLLVVNTASRQLQVIDLKRLSLQP